MKGIVGTALDLLDEQALIVDLSEVDYSSGDMLFYWRSAFDDMGIGPDDCTVALVCSQSNFLAIKELLESEQDEELTNATFQDIDSAIEYVARATK